jgi:hypothetical protein
MDNVDVDAVRATSCVLWGGVDVGALCVATCVTHASQDAYIHLVEVEVESYISLASGRVVEWCGRWGA